LLDRALITKSINQDKEINEIDVRQMLGLADRGKLISLFREILLGEQKKAVIQLRELIDNGLDARNFLNDILEILYLFSRRINLGPIEKDMMISETEVHLIDNYSKSLDMQDLGLFWQLTIKTLDDLKTVGNENLTLEMFIMQIIHLKNVRQTEEQKIKINSDLDLNEHETNNEEIDKNETNSEKAISPIKNQLKSTNQIKESVIKNPELRKELKTFSKIKNFQDLINLASNAKEVELKYDLERNVKLVSFNKGKIDIGFNENLNKNFIKILTEKLLTWTGERWIISLSKNEGEKTFYEKKINKEFKKLEKEKKGEVSKKILTAFPDAKLINVEDNDD
jgi:DNA polymerase-3 subunit gamma/tau